MLPTLKETAAARGMSQKDYVAFLHELYHGQHPDQLLGMLSRANARGLDHRWVAACSALLTYLVALKERIGFE